MEGPLESREGAKRERMRDFRAAVDPLFLAKAGMPAFTFVTIFIIELVIKAATLQLRVPLSFD